MVLIIIFQILIKFLIYTHWPGNWERAQSKVISKKILFYYKFSLILLLRTINRISMIVIVNIIISTSLFRMDIDPSPPSPSASHFSVISLENAIMVFIQHHFTLFLLKLLLMLLLLLPCFVNVKIDVVLVNALVLL